MMPCIRPAIFLIGVVFVISEAAADVTFTRPTVIETPGATADILVLDLDGDGDLDIASLEVEFNFATGEATGMVNVALNDGAAGFSTLATYELGTFGALEFVFRTLVAADLDDDGDPDLAAIGTTAPLVLLFNDGRGGFGRAVDTGIVVSPGPLTALLDAGDLDGDGDVDLALGLPGQIATNDGFGAFTASPFSDDSNPRNLEIVDLDGDGDEDIAYGFRVHLNDGTGTFTLQGATYPGSGAAECVFADFDGDGDQDVACARNFPGEITIALNNGDATFAAPAVFETAAAPIDLQLGRFDGDNHLDLLVTHSSVNGIIGVYTGNGDGTFDDAIILPSPDGTIAAAGDLDGDGLDDIVISTTFVLSNGPIAVLLNDSEFPADLTGSLGVPDGCVDAFDLGVMLGAWCSGVNDPNRPSPPCENCIPANLALADISGARNAPDGCVDAFDLAKLLAEWCSVGGRNPCGTCGP